MINVTNGQVSPWNKFMLGYCVQLHYPLGFYGAGQARSSSLVGQWSKHVWAREGPSGSI